MADERPGKRIKRRRSLMGRSAPELVAKTRAALAKPAALAPTATPAKPSTDPVAPPTARSKPEERVRRRRSLFKKRHITLAKTDPDLASHVIETKQVNGAAPKKNPGLRRTTASKNNSSAMDDFASELDAFMALDDF